MSSTRLCAFRAALESPRVGIKSLEQFLFCDLLEFRHDCDASLGLQWALRACFAEWIRSADALLAWIVCAPRSFRAAHCDSNLVDVPVLDDNALWCSGVVEVVCHLRAMRLFAFRAELGFQRAGFLTAAATIPQSHC